jgi:putative hemolysin
MNLFLILFLTVLNGLFAMSEMALAASRKARLDALAAANKPGATAALALMEHPTNFLSTVQVGITSIGLLNGIMGDSAFSPVVARWLQMAGAPETVAHFSATALVVTVITFVTLIFGELVPKRIGQLYPEKIASFMARPMTWLARVARPFVLLLSGTTQAILRLLPFDTQSARRVTEEEIAASLVEGVDAGLIEEHEHRMVRNVFKLDERELSSIMVPRNEVMWFDAQTTVAEALQTLSAAGGRIHSWYPVCKASLDDVVGIVGLGQLLIPGANVQHVLGDIALPASFVPETISGMELLEQFRDRAHRLIFVVDEYGEVQGILTPRDLLEAITGELQPHLQNEAWGTLQKDRSWLFDGMIPVNELKNKLDIEETLPEEEKNLYNTLAGLLMFVSGELPFIGQEVVCAGWQFVVDTLDGKRAQQVRAYKLTTDIETI